MSSTRKASKPAKATTKSAKTAKKRAAVRNEARQAEVAEHIGVTQSRVAQFVSEGVFTKLPSGRLDLDACRHAYIAWLRDQSRKSTNSAAAQRVQDARAEEIQLRLEERRKSHIKAGQAAAVDVIDESFGTLKAELLAIPARVTTDITTRRKIEDELAATFAACAKRAFAAADLVDNAEETINRAVLGEPRRSGVKARK